MLIWYRGIVCSCKTIFQKNNLVSSFIIKPCTISTHKCGVKVTFGRLVVFQLQVLDLFNLLHPIVPLFYVGGLKVPHAAAYGDYLKLA